MRFSAIETSASLSSGRSGPPRLSGSTLIMVIGVLAMLAVVVSTFVSVSRLNERAAVARYHTIKLEVLAEGMLTQVRSMIARDLEQTQEPFDHPRFDPWLASVLPSNIVNLSTNPNAADRWRYISRLDLADVGWNNGAGAALGGRPAENLSINNFQTFGAANFADVNRDGVPDYMASASMNLRYYVDADGDGRADSYLGPIGQGVAFPDGTCAYAAVRIVDNAHLNSTHHQGWPPYITNAAYGSGTCMPWQVHVEDTTDGRVDWTYLPDSTDPNTGSPRLVPRPRLPHVGFNNLRNMGVGLFGSRNGWADNADAGAERQTEGFSRLPTGWTWESSADVYRSSSWTYYMYMPGEMLPGGINPIPGAAPVPVGAPPPGGRNTITDRVDMFTPPFRIEDDLAIRTWQTDPAVSKYAQVWRICFGSENLGGAAPTFKLPVVNYEHHFMRCVSSITRERTHRWWPGVTAGNDTAYNTNATYSTPVDLRKLIGPGSNGNEDWPGTLPSPRLISKLNRLCQLFEQYGILGNRGSPGAGYINSPNGIGYVQTSGRPLFDQMPHHRRAQYLANLAEYIRPAPPNGAVVRPTPYDITTNAGVLRKYGVCRQPFITEVLRYGGPIQTVAPGAARNWNAVRVGIELYNPFDTDLSLENYELVVDSHAHGAITYVGPSTTIPLAAFGAVPANGFIWIATDGVLPVPQQVQSAIQAMRFVGPRMAIRLRARALDNTPILMDFVDTRTQANGGPFTAGIVHNENIQVTNGGVPRSRGIDWSDWEGLPIPAPAIPGFVVNPAQVVGLANQGGVNATDGAVNLIGRLSGIFRPMGPRILPFSSSYWRPPVGPSFATGLFRGYAPVQPTAQQPLDLPLTSSAQLLLAATVRPGFSESYPVRATPGTYNGPSQSPDWYSTPVITEERDNGGAILGSGRYIFGARINLPNRGADLMAGARFLNLGELTLVMTVGNSPDVSGQPQQCITMATANASEYARTLALNSMSPWQPPFSRPPTPPSSGFPSYYGTGISSWSYINFDREIFFNIWENARIGPAGMPIAENARILDIVSLYMGNGANFELTDFDRFTGDVADTHEDYQNGGLVRAAYREGRININTAPWIVLTCLPVTRSARDDMDSAFSGTYAQNGYSKGQMVIFSYAMAGTATGQEGYLQRSFQQTYAGDGFYPNVTMRTSQLDPYFAYNSDVFMFARGANPHIAGKFFNNAGVGWDSHLHCDYGYFSYLGGGYKQYDHLTPHCHGYRYNLDKTFLAGNWNNKLAREFSEWGGHQGLGLRDSIWASCTNVASTRSDVFTAYILLKLIRPTPGVPQPENANLQWQDLGELRLVAILDRTNCRVLTAGPNAGQVGPELPRILGRVMREQY